MTEQQFQRALSLDEQIVLITGGARGLGAALSRAFSRSGARVIVNYNKSRDAAETLVTELGEDRAFAVQADVTDRSSVDQLFSPLHASDSTHRYRPWSTMHSSTSRSTATPGRARTRSPGPTSTLNYAEPLPAHSTPPRQPSPACANSDSAESSLSEPIWSRIR